MESNNDRKCPMDCAKCSFRQNVYCASQIGLSSHEVITRLAERLEVCESKINDVLERVNKNIDILESLQADMLIEPMAQEEEAAQIIDSPNKQSK